MSSRRHNEASTNQRPGTSEYTAWVSMRQRCRDVNATNYKNYGARGITICDRWETFENFLADLGRRPSAAHSLDRIDNEGDYTPENCRWATAQQQARNQRSNKKLTIHGVTKSACGWADAAGVDRHLFYNRLRRGWSPLEALAIPVGAIVGKPYGPRGTHTRAGRFVTEAAQ